VLEPRFGTAISCSRPSHVGGRHLAKSSEVVTTRLFYESPSGLLLYDTATTVVSQAPFHFTVRARGACVVRRHFVYERLTGSQTEEAFNGTGCRSDVGKLEFPTEFGR
jgi:hypothetical protein